MTLRLQRRSTFEVRMFVQFGSCLWVCLALREIVSSSPNRKKVIYIVHALYERLITPNESWLVVLKALMVFHKLLKADGEAGFKQEVLKSHIWNLKEIV